MTSTKQIMQLFDGEEMWTDALTERFQERVCVLFQGRELVCDGKYFVPTSQEVKAIYKEYCTEGEGAYLLKELEQEFDVEFVR